MNKYFKKTYRHFMHDSLYRNSIYLLANMAVTAVTGFVFVIICTRFYPQKELGYATALIGALGLATALSNIGMNRTIVRFLGKSKTKSQDLVTKLALVAIGATLSAIIMSFFFRSLGIKNASLTTSIIFTVTVLLMSIKGIFDNVFVATRVSAGSLIENSLFSITKLVFLFLVIGSGFIGIFSAQLAGAFVAVAASVLLLSRKYGFSFKTKPSRSSLQGKWRFAFGSYTSDLVGGLPASLLPIIVVARLGPIQGALWFTAMQIINFLLAVSSSINQAMFAEMANATGGIGAFVKKAAVAMYSILIPLSLAIFILAPFILRLFNGNYVAATHVLRLMTIFALIGVANYITGSIIALYKKVMFLTVVNAVNAVIVIIYCFSVATNLSGIATGWMLGEVANVILFVGGALYFYNQQRLKAFNEES